MMTAECSFWNISQNFILRIAILFSCLLVDALNAFLILLDGSVQNIHDLPEKKSPLTNQNGNF